MNNFRKHRSTAFTMIFIIVFTILLDFYVNLLKFRDQESFSKTMLSRIETSNLQLNVFSQGIFAKHEKVLVASTNPPPRNKNLNSSIIFASSRNSNQIKVFLWKNKELKLTSRHKLNAHHNESKLLDSVDASSYFIFDLLVINERLYVSSVLKHLEDKKCDEIRIITIDIDAERERLYNEREFWKYPGCIKWKDEVEPSGNLSLRLTSNNKAIFMSVGLEQVMPYTNIYPSDGLLDLPSSFKLSLLRYPIFGSLLKIPFLNRDSSEFEVVAKGLRSPQGLIFESRDDSSEIFWISDHGPRGGDELNRLILKDFSTDFGWPNVSFGTYYMDLEKDLSTVLPVKFGTHEGYAAPVFFWTPSIAPSQILSIPDAFPDISNQWEGGDLLLATLKDESIHKLIIDDRGFVLSDERIFLGERIRDMDWLSGSVILGTDTGKIVIVTPKPLLKHSGPFPSFVIPPTMQEVTIKSYIELRFKPLFVKIKSILGN